MVSREQFTQLIGKLDIQQFEYLEKLFQQCPNNVFECMRQMRVRRGQVFIQAGDSCDAVYIILKGSAGGIDMQRLGNAYRFMEYSSTDILGDFELLGDIREYRITVRAVNECEILAIPSATYLEWMEHDINALFMRTRKLMNTLTNEASEVRKYLFLSCRDRLILYLVESYDKRAKGGKYRINKTQSELAESVGFTVRTIQRTTKSLEKEGYISNESGKICISQEQYLKLKEYMEDNLLN